jgi:hypothetical protein
MKITILNEILSQFPKNQYFFNSNDINHRNDVAKDFFNKSSFDVVFKKKEELDDFSNVIYPIVNLNNLGTDGLDVFSEELKHLINKGLKVFILHLNECFLYDEFEDFLNYLNTSSINQQNIYLFVNNDRIKDYKEKLKSNINFYFPFFQSIEHSLLLQRNKINFTSNQKRFLFMCHNNKMWPHRLSTLMLLKNKNILNDVDFSCVDFYEMRGRELSYLKPILGDEYESFESEFKYFRSLGPSLSYYEKSFNFNEIDSPKIETKTFEESYINIVTETDFTDEVIHITEKSLKPFYYFQYPIFVAPYGHVKRLKEIYDFDFFEDIIDHSYDNEPNHEKRIKKVFVEIEKLKNNKKEIINNYQNHMNRFLNNNKIVCDISDNKNDNKYINKILYGN